MALHPLQPGEDSLLPPPLTVECPAYIQACRLNHTHVVLLGAGELALLPGSKVAAGGRRVGWAVPGSPSSSPDWGGCCAAGQVYVSLLDGGALGQLRGEDGQPCHATCIALTQVCCGSAGRAWPGGPAQLQLRHIMHSGLLLRPGPGPYTSWSLQSLIAVGMADGSLTFYASGSQELVSQYRHECGGLAAMYPDPSGSKWAAALQQLLLESCACLPPCVKAPRLLGAIVVAAC